MLDWETRQNAAQRDDVINVPSWAEYYISVPTELPFLPPGVRLVMRISSMTSPFEDWVSSMVPFVDGIPCLHSVILQFDDLNVLKIINRQLHAVSSGWTVAPVTTYVYNESRNLDMKGWAVVDSQTLDVTGMLLFPDSPHTRHTFANWLNFYLFKKIFRLRYQGQLVGRLTVLCLAVDFVGNPWSWLEFVCGKRDDGQCQMYRREPFFFSRV